MLHKTRASRRRGKRLLVLVIFLLVLTACGKGYVWWRQNDQHQNTAARNIAETSSDEPLAPPAKASSVAQTIMPPAPSRDYTIPPVTNGLAPILSRIPTKEPVVFLGIDDGANKQPSEIQIMRDNGVKASLFLANRFIQDNPYFFQGFLAGGSLIEDHTLDHKLLSHLSYAEQKQEICGQADLEQQEFGRRPVLFRPPGGDYNTDTERAAAACGMQAVVLWIAKANGGSMQYQIGHQLRPGDIVLMHFRPEFKSDMQAFLTAQKAVGLHTELLENWLQPTPLTGRPSTAGFGE